MHPMTTDPFHAIPAARRDAVDAAMAAAFGARGVGEVRLLTGGVSGAGIYRVEVGGRPYVLRLEPERIALEHRTRHFDCMSAAARAGVAPAVHHADAVAGVAVMDFVEARPLAEHPGGAAGLARELGGLIARVQETPAFPSLGDGGDLIAGLLDGLARSGLFGPGILDRHGEGLARIRAACPWDPSGFVSSHNDPNPRNMLFDGRRVWLVDWELACRNDPLFDLAILTTELAATPELEAILLTAAFGRAPDAALSARVAVTRLLTRLFYGCIVLESLGPATEASLEALTPAEFKAAIADGRLGSGSAATAQAFGKMSLRAFVDGVSAPGFAATLDQAAEAVRPPRRR
jgi:aminoglycoside phosphotransferase (APT) family kinase protein